MPAFLEIALPSLTSSISSALGKTASCLAALPASPLGAFPGVGALTGERGRAHKCYPGPQTQGEAHPAPQTP